MDELLHWGSGALVRDQAKPSEVEIYLTSKCEICA